MMGHKHWQLRRYHHFLHFNSRYFSFVYDFQALYENMLVELPFASFFSCKLLSKHGTDVDIHHLESLDPEMYRYYHGSFLSLFCVRPRLFTPYVCLFILYLAANINTISNVAVHGNGEKGYVRRFHLLRAMRCRELEGYLTWHCFYVHYNVCLFFLFVYFYFLTCLGTCCSSKTIQETSKICRSTLQWWIMT